MRCNILRRPALPGGNLKEKQFHIKLSDTMQVCGAEEEGGLRGRKAEADSECVCVCRDGGGVGVFRSSLTAIG